MAQKTCFVVQGFGKKTDFQTGRVLDLDASYDVIKEAVEGAGLECVRADEIQHSASIEVPMYEQILNADLVIADLSTSNLNAAYELGVRHALRPHTTIIVAENKFSFPFDVNHIAIRTYEHLGSDIGRREAKRFINELKEAIAAVLDRPKTDSPVYTFISNLQPPVEGEGEVIETGVIAVPKGDEESVKVKMDVGKRAIVRGEFMTAKGMLTELHDKRPKDDYITQQLALATHKSEFPTAEAALEEARSLLEKLGPETSHDTETLGLWGAVHKRLWQLTEDRAHLDVSIAAYERGFQLRNDYYNGVNFAYLLNVRATLSEPADAIADWVQAGRVRRKVIPLCEQELEAGPETEEERYWILATLWEAAVGLGDAAGVEKWSSRAKEAAPAPWMVQSTAEQLAGLAELLADSPLKHIAAT